MATRPWLAFQAKAMVKMDKVVKLDGGGSVVNEATPSSFRTAPATPGLLITSMLVEKSKNAINVGTG